MTPFGNCYFLCRWRHLWSAIADYFGVEAEGPRSEPIDMVQTIMSQDQVWEDIVRDNNLQTYKLQDITQYWLLNLSLRKPMSCFADMSKSREMGFLKYQNTEKSFFKLFDYLKQVKIIPS